MSLKRLENALYIDNGACNPHAIIRSMLAAADELREGGCDTKAVRHDPALQLMVYQLAFICGVLEFEHDHKSYAKAREEVVTLRDAYLSGRAETAPA